MEGNNTENKQDVNLVSEQLCHCHQKATPRRKEELKILKNRLNRIVGQLNGIGKMRTVTAGTFSCRQLPQRVHCSPLHI